MVLHVSAQQCQQRRKGQPSPYLEGHILLTALLTAHLKHAQSPGDDAEYDALPFSPPNSQPQASGSPSCLCCQVARSVSPSPAPLPCSGSKLTSPVSLLPLSRGGGPTMAPVGELKVLYSFQKAPSSLTNPSLASCLTLMWYEANVSSSPEQSGSGKGTNNCVLFSSCHLQLCDV